MKRVVKNLKVVAETVPECEKFFKIQWEDENFITIDEFIKNHPYTNIMDIGSCHVNYRGTCKLLHEFIEDYIRRSNKMEFIPFHTNGIYIDPSIRASVYFMKKTNECLKTARFFTMKSMSIIEPDYYLPWKQGYVPQFYFRCIYFGTAATWFSNTMDNLLQTIYWAFELYKGHNNYNENWSREKTMWSCNSKFVEKELKNRGLTDIHELITECLKQLNTVREWANYIKHKGGLDYLYLEADEPFKFYVAPLQKDESLSTCCKLGEKFEIKNFESPIQIDIDKELHILEEAHKNLYESIIKAIDIIDYDKYVVNLRSITNEQNEI